MSESENLKSKLMFYMIFVAIDLFIIIRVPVTARSVSHDKPRIFPTLAPTTGPVPIKLLPPASPGLVILGLAMPTRQRHILSDREPPFTAHLPSQAGYPTRHPLPPLHPARHRRGHPLALSCRTQSANVSHWLILCLIYEPVTILYIQLARSDVGQVSHPKEK